MARNRRPGNPKGSPQSSPPFEVTGARNWGDVAAASKAAAAGEDPPWWERVSSGAELFTLGDISLKTAVPERLLRFWTDSGLLRPAAVGHPGRAEHPGRGTPRRFSRIELQIAALLWPLASAGGQQIGYLQRFSFMFRRALTGEGPPRERVVGGTVDNSAIRRAVDRAARGEGENFVVVCAATDGRAKVEVVTDEAGPPLLDLTKLRFTPEGYSRGDSTTIIVNLTDSLATLTKDN
jgi:hypothetical protein